MLLIDLHMTKLVPEKKVLRRWLSRHGSGFIGKLLQFQQADMCSKGVDVSEELPQFNQLREILRQIEEENACLSLKDLAVKGNDLVALGITGPAIGKALKAMLELVIDEQLPNEKPALLAWLTKQP